MALDVLETLLSFILGIGGSYIATATQPPIPNPWQQRLNAQLADEAALRDALATQRPLRDELRRACRTLSQDRALLGDLAEPERHIWRLLSDATFQDDLADWLTTGGIPEGTPARERLEQHMERALQRGGANAEQRTALKTHYIDTIDRAIFSIPPLAAWRHHLSLDYLRNQVAAVKLAAEKAAGIFPEDTRQAALTRYYDIALRTWDIVDLSNLPEGDIHLPTQLLLLRQLYMPLRINVEIERTHTHDDTAFALLEQRRDRQRRQAAGHLDDPPTARKRASIGVRLAASQRLVILGDPGGGKSTLLRWMATCFLLRLRHDPAIAAIPDNETLPDWPAIPILIRCRDLGEADLCRSFADILSQHLRKSELLPHEADILTAVILERIAQGTVLLLIDGLDEITHSSTRIQFCQELERTATRYPTTPIIITSRIVGYRDMPYRMSNNFEHGTIAELDHADKDSFAQRWIAVTEQHQPPAERQRRKQELLDALHANDRIERLTGNPMMLTTLALVKRKVGKLPSRRNKLYAEAVSVLLNWNPRHYQTIDDAEALPQLAYIAYEMCRSGVQRLTEERILDLLDRIRTDYPNIRPIRQRTSHAFLTFLEARSSILIKSGGEWRAQRTHEEPVWEFRHLTFQEYLAARALIEGRYPDRDRTKSLAEIVAPLAGTLNKEAGSFRIKSDEEISDSWKETLRLLVVDCKDDDVDDVLRAIATPLPTEDATRTTRPRAVLAARCLADEPNVSEETARELLEHFVAQISERDGGRFSSTSLDDAALEVRCSMWDTLLNYTLMRTFFQKTTAAAANCGRLWGMIATMTSPSEPAFESWLHSLIETLGSADDEEAASAALTIMGISFTDRVIHVPGIIEGLLDLLRRPEPLRMAAAWALSWLSDRVEDESPWSDDHFYIWQPQPNDVLALIEALQLPDTMPMSALALAQILANNYDTQATAPLIALLDDPNAGMRREAAEALGSLGDREAVKPLIALLDDTNVGVRLAVIEALEQLGDRQAVVPLTALLDDPNAGMRREAAEALGSLGDRDAVKPLIALLDDTNVGVRLAVIEALEQLGDRQAVVPLTALLDDPEAIVRRAVVMALGSLGDRQAVTPLIALLDDPNAGMRRAVAVALGSLDDRDAVMPLIARLDDPEAMVRQEVAKALGSLDDRRAVMPLIARLDDPNTGVRRAVVVALGQLGDREAVPPLIARLDDPNAGVRRALAAALGQLGGPDAIAALLAHLNEPNEAVRCQVAAALQRCGDPRGLHLLTTALTSGQEETRRAAFQAFAAVQDKATRRLLSCRFDAIAPWLDPIQPITQHRVQQAARHLNLTVDDIQAHYEALAADLPLILEWRTSTDKPSV